MYYISEDFNNACNDYVRTWHSKCVVNEGKSNEITLVNNVPQNCLGAMTWESSINADDALAMGQTGMDKLTLEITRLQANYNLQNATFHPYVGIDINGETVWCSLGFFYADDVTTDDNYFTTSVTAYDGMSLLSDTFDESELVGIHFPCSARALLIAIANRFRLTIDATTYTILRSLEGYILRDSAGKILVVDSLRQSMGEVYEGTYRDYIGWIAGLQGCNAHFDREGQLAFSYYSDSVMTINPSVIYMNGLTLNKGGTVTYTSFLSGSEENPVVPTRYSGNAISFMNPYITAQDLDNIGDNILPITYQPCELHYRGNPCLDVGDRITVNDAKGNTHTVFIMQRTLSMTGGLDDTIQCFGMTEEQATLDSAPTTRKIKQIYTSLQKAIKEASDYLNNTTGVFEWIDNGDGTNGGFTILASDNSSLIKCTAGGIGVSLDGGNTFQNAITRNGINASVIRTGTLNASDILIEQDGSNSKLKIENGGMYIYNSANKVIGQYTSSGLSFSNNGRMTINNSSGNKVAEFTPFGAYWYDGNGYVRTEITPTDTYYRTNGVAHGRISSSLSGDYKMFFVGTPMDGDASTSYMTVHGGGGGTMSITPSIFNFQHSEMYNFMVGTNGSTTSFNLAVRIADAQVDFYRNLDMHNYSILNQSDIRLKENVSATPVTALDTIDRMRFVEFDWKEDGRHDDLGLIAQELQKINPSMVVDTGEYLAVNTSKFIMYALKAIQELSQQIKEMKGADV